MKWFGKGKGGQGTTSPATPKDPKGLVKFGETAATAPQEHELRAWATRTWGEGNFTIGREKGGKVFLASKNPEPPKAKVPDPDEVTSLLDTAIAARDHFPALGKVVTDLGKTPPKKWWDTLKTHADDLERPDGELIVILSVLVTVGESLSGDKRRQTLEQFVLGLPEELRERAALLVTGAYATFFLLKKAKVAEAGATAKAVAAKPAAAMAPPRSGAPAAGGDDGALRLA